jgi:hypothetical protein
MTEHGPGKSCHDRVSLSQRLLQPMPLPFISWGDRSFCRHILNPAKLSVLVTWTVGSDVASRVARQRGAFGMPWDTNLTSHATLLTLYACHKYFRITICLQPNGLFPFPSMVLFLATLHFLVVILPSIRASVYYLYDLQSLYSSWFKQMWRLRLLVNLERWVCLAHNHTHHIQRWRRLRCVIRILRAAVVEICSVKACGCRQFMGEPNNMCALCGVRRVSLGLRATTTTLMLLVATCVASNHTFSVCS